jgi:hypothetical protein
MKKAKTYFWLKTAGLLSALIVMLIGTPGCREKRHQTKYGPPPADYDMSITKYGVPMDNDSAYFDQTVTKYGVPADFDIEETPEVPDTTKAE